MDINSVNQVSSGQGTVSGVSPRPTNEQDVAAFDDAMNNSPAEPESELTTADVRDLIRRQIVRNILEHTRKTTQEFKNL